MEKRECISYFKENKIAVLIPTYNNSGTIAHVVESVLDYCADLIVVNDGSTDDTQNILKHYPQLVE